LIVPGKFVSLAKIRVLFYFLFPVFGYVALFIGLHLIVLLIVRLAGRLLRGETSYKRGGSLFSYLNLSVLALLLLALYTRNRDVGMFSLIDRFHPIYFIFFSLVFLPIVAAFRRLIVGAALRSRLWRNLFVIVVPILTAVGLAGTYLWKTGKVEESVKQTITAPMPGNRHDNVLLIVLDTLRADHLRCYGNDSVLTPNIDRLAGGRYTFQLLCLPGTVDVTLPHIDFHFNLPCIPRCPKQSCLSSGFITGNPGRGPEGERIPDGRFRQHIHS